MSMTSTVRVVVSVLGDGVDETWNPCQNLPGSALVNASCPAAGPVPVSLSSGDNAVPVPAGTRTVVVRPPPGSAVALRWGTGGTAGLIDPGNPSVMSVPVGTTVVGINAAAPVVVGIGYH